MVLVCLWSSNFTRFVSSMINVQQSNDLMHNRLGLKGEI